MAAPRFWLLKTEPETYSFEQLARDGKTPWNGVRNFQARNFLKAAQVGDIALIYHSGKDKAVVGTAKVSREAYPDPDPKKPGDWVQIDLTYDATLKTPVTLAQMKTDKALAGLKLLKQGRLSCMPVTAAEYKRFMSLGGKA